MRGVFTRQRAAMALSILGVCLMGIDLLLTRSIFTHIGELMIASLLCFAAGIALDRPRPGKNAESARRIEDAATAAGKRRQSS